MGLVNDAICRELEALRARLGLLETGLGRLEDAALAHRREFAAAQERLGLGGRVKSLEAEIKILRDTVRQLDDKSERISLIEGICNRLDRNQQQVLRTLEAIENPSENVERSDRSLARLGDLNDLARGLSQEDTRLRTRIESLERRVNAHLARIGTLESVVRTKSLESVLQREPDDGKLKCFVCGNLVDSRPAERAGWYDFTCLTAIGCGLVVSLRAVTVEGAKSQYRCFVNVPDEE